MAPFDLRTQVELIFQPVGEPRREARTVERRYAFRHTSMVGCTPSICANCLAGREIYGDAT
jgi:hypothetical protein